jgi:FkbM family methyltransferase
LAAVAIAQICEHTILVDLIRPGASVLDLGGNRGDFARALAERYGARVCVAEPVPSLFAAIPELPGIRKLACAVGGETGVLALRLPDDRCATGHAHAATEGAPVLRVRQLGFRDFVAEFPDLREIDLVKTDIEGAELGLFAAMGAEDFTRIRQLTVEFHDFLYPETGPAVEAAKRRIRSFGFHCIPFSRTNGDVLFVRRDVIGRARFLWLRYVVRNARGIARMVRRLLGREAGRGAEPVRPTPG